MIFNFPLRFRQKGDAPLPSGHHASPRFSADFSALGIDRFLEVRYIPHIRDDTIPGGDHATVY